LLVRPQLRNRTANSGATNKLNTPAQTKKKPAIHAALPARSSKSAI